ncbi:MAG: Type 1 glutamine amidotransferase-like domain-containing protein [Patescibacteria group bacterium]
MKLFLTSNGISNKSIAEAFIDLVGKPASEIHLAFIPTAMNVSRGDKSWFIDDLSNLKNLGLKFIDIVDISALPQDIWLPKLEKANVLFFSGGTSAHLMYWMKKSGLKELLPELLKTKVYAGISAGSIVTAPTLLMSNKRSVYKELTGYDDNDALGLVPFYFYPHLHSPDSPKNTKENLTKVAEKIKEPIYALDDESALKVVDEEVEVVSEGKYLIFNQSKL